MIQRKSNVPVRELPYMERFDLPGERRFVTPETECSVKSLSGRFFWMGTVNADGSLNMFGGRPGYLKMRSVMPDRIQPHRKVTMRGKA